MLITFTRLFVLFWVLLGLAYASGASAVQPSGSRIALVIGNADYGNGALKNPVNDARAVADKLEKLGFKVLLRENLKREAMHQSISEFGDALEQGGVGLFYYAGHGMQIKGRNFLVPVDADIQSEDDIEFRGIDANMVLARMNAARSRVNLMVLDACRNNPFSINNRSVSLGLAQMDAPKGTLIAFSTAPGSLAKDGKGTNSVYTKHLIQYLATPAMPVEEVFKEVRVAVAKETDDKQIPWESSSLMGDFYFVPPSQAVNPALAKSSPPVIQERKPDTGRSQPIVQPQALAPPQSQDKPAGAKKFEHDYNREGYEIELMAKSLTVDQLLALWVKASRGNVVAQTTLGWAYLLGKGQIDGRGIPRDNTQMIHWTKLAADHGYAVAQNNLGAIYMDGTGVKLDYQKAQHYFKLSADQGYIAAQRNLLQVSAMLNGKLDMNLFNDMSKAVQQQIFTPVK